jgi:RNA polymerase sigma factor (sigma-70 family)
VMGNDPLEAFGAWYAEQHPRVFASMLVICRDRELASEVTAEAFVRALERWDRVQRMASPDGWLWVVARNALRALHRREARRRRSEDDAARSAQFNSPAAMPGLEVEVWDAVARLSRREREVVALRYLVGMTEADVAFALGIAPGSAARALHDARAHLAAALGDPHTQLELP